MSCNCLPALAGRVGGQGDFAMTGTCRLQQRSRRRLKVPGHPPLPGSGDVFQNDSLSHLVLARQCDSALTSCPLSQQVRQRVQQQHPPAPPPLRRFSAPGESVVLGQQVHLFPMQSGYFFSCCFIVILFWFFCWSQVESFRW